MSDESPNVQAARALASGDADGANRLIARGVAWCDEHGSFPSNTRCPECFPDDDNAR